LDQSRKRRTRRKKRVKKDLRENVSLALPERAKRLRFAGGFNGEHFSRRKKTALEKNPKKRAGTLGGRDLFAGRKELLGAGGTALLR